MTRPIILTFTGFYLPGYKAGGPIQSIANLVAHLGDEIDFRIVTSDRDSGDLTPFAGAARRQWLPVGKALVRYVALRDQTLPEIVKIMRETPHDALYLNSFFRPRLTGLPLLARRLGLTPRRPLIVAPRGEFSSSALGLKPYKKRAYIAAARALRLYDRAVWHASSSYEEEDIRRVVGSNANIHIATDLPRVSNCSLAQKSRERGQPLRVVFLSRIAPMKNLKFALRVLSLVRVPVEFTIVGFIDDKNYWEECKNIIKQLPSHISSKYEGIVPANEVQSIMAQNDLFFLPTLGENFGHVIIESLGAGVPALISDRTPWRGLRENGCGWAEPLEDPRIFAERIEALYEEVPEMHAARRDAALLYARRFIEESDNVNSNRALFQRAIRESIQ